MNYFIALLKRFWRTTKYVFSNNRGETKPEEWWKDKNGNSYLKIGKKSLKISSQYVGEQPMAQKIIRLIEREISK